MFLRFSREWALNQARLLSAPVRLAIACLRTSPPLVQLGPRPELAAHQQREIKGGGLSSAMGAAGRVLQKPKVSFPSFPSISPALLAWAYITRTGGRACCESKLTRKPSLPRAIATAQSGDAAEAAGAPKGWQLDPASGYYFDVETQMYFDPRRASARPLACRPIISSGEPSSIRRVVSAFLTLRARFCRTKMYYNCRTGEWMAALQARGTRGFVLHLQRDACRACCLPQLALVKSELRRSLSALFCHRRSQGNSAAVAAAQAAAAGVKQPRQRVVDKFGL